ncbi:MAG: hypothetical protein AB9921_02500 [Erysipelotrichaceae bacterium]
MNIRIRKLGYIAVEAVITAALILSVGFIALLNLSGGGASLMGSKLAKLDALNLFGGGDSYTSTMSYDENGYIASLNVNPADINPLSDFTFIKNSTGWTLTDYLNTLDTTVVIPKYNSDGEPITKIGMSAFHASASYQETAVTFTDKIFSGMYVYAADGPTEDVSPGE